MKRSQITKMPNYFDRYINLVDDVDVVEALEKYGQPFLEKERASLEQLSDEAYAPGKWTIKELLQHLIDAERIFAYRALRFARNDKTGLPGFDEDSYAKNAQAKTRTVDDLLEEFALQRRSNILLFNSFGQETLMREGTASGNSISVLALGFTMTGHIVHHMNIVKERYFPLLGA